MCQYNLCVLDRHVLPTEIAAVMSGNTPNGGELGRLLGHLYRRVRHPQPSIELDEDARKNFGQQLFDERLKGDVQDQILENRGAA